MIALGILLVAVFYVSLAISLAWLFARGFQSRRAKTTVGILTLLVFALIPTWDIIPGKLYFNHLCKTEAGSRLYKTAERVEGFRYKSGLPSREMLSEYGYRYIEGTDATGNLSRYSIGQNGKVTREKISAPSSRFVFEVEGGTWVPLKFNVSKYKGAIIDTRTGMTLATITSFSYAGNWLQKRAAPLLGHGGKCPVSPNYTSFLLSTLQPVKQ